MITPYPHDDLATHPGTMVFLHHHAGFNTIHTLTLPSGTQGFSMEEI